MDSVEQINKKVADEMALASVVKDERMMAFFRYEHLPEKLQQVSKPFCELAVWVVLTQPQTPERTVCLRKLLESKDCAVRNML